MRKGMLEFCVLLLLRQDDAYASEMIDKLKEARLIVMEGTLYPLLTRLKNDGLLSYRWEESPQGPPRKYYTITSAGLEVLNKLSEVWEEMVSCVNHLQNPPDPLAGSQVIMAEEKSGESDEISVIICEEIHPAKSAEEPNLLPPDLPKPSGL